MSRKHDEEVINHSLCGSSRTGGHRRFLALFLAVLSLYLLYVASTNVDTIGQGRQQQHYRRALPASGDEPSPVVPPSLKRVLFCITFHWNVAKLVYLESMMAATTTYKTDVDILIVTDNARNVKRVLEHWGYFENLRVWQAPEETLNIEEEEYSLLWGHKVAIEEQLEGENQNGRGEYTSVIYVEDDTRLGWATLVSWALDTEVLEPLQYTRCIYRTETSFTDGYPNLLDWTHPVRMNKTNTLDVKVGNPSTFENVSARIQGMNCGTLQDGTSWQCTVHRYFVSPDEPFQGMWMATRKQLMEYMSHPYWNKTAALEADLELERYWGYPERSNSLNILIHRRQDLQSSCMVPYISGKRFAVGSSKWILSPVANVEHLRNGYSDSEWTEHGKLPLIKALTR